MPQRAGLLAELLLPQDREFLRCLRLKGRRLFALFLSVVEVCLRLRLASLRIRNHPFDLGRVSVKSGPLPARLRQT
ncbi:hypothetical protein LJR034_003043 [Caballeronia sp. LjRoot34]